MKKILFLVIAIVITCSSFATNSINRKNLNNEKQRNYVEVNVVNQAFTQTPKAVHSYYYRSSDREFSCKIKIVDNKVFLYIHSEKKGWFGWYNYETKYYINYLGRDLSMPDTFFQDGYIGSESFGERKSNQWLPFYLPLIKDINMTPDSSVKGMRFEIWTRGIGEKNKGMIIV